MPRTWPGSSITIDHRHHQDWRFAPLEADDLEHVAPARIVLASATLSTRASPYGDRLRGRCAGDLELYRGPTMTSSRWSAFKAGDATGRRGTGTRSTHGAN